MDLRIGCKSAPRPPRGDGPRWWGDTLGLCGLMDGREAAIALVAAAAGAGAALLALRCSAAPRSDTQRAAGGATIVGVASDPSVESTPAQRAELAALRDQAISPEAAAAAEHDFVQISAEPLDVNAVVAQVVVRPPSLTLCRPPIPGPFGLIGGASAAAQDPGAGGVSLFIGTTRDNFNGRSVTRLEYEAFESMAIKEMRKVAAAMRSRWTDNGGLVRTPSPPAAPPAPQRPAPDRRAAGCAQAKVAMVHRIGVCPVEEPSVIVACSSAHRIECLEAASFGIDSLKATVPVWKKEVYGEGEGTPQWKENKEFRYRKKN